MSPEQFKRLEDLFAQAAAVPADQRDAWLDRACGDDATLRHELRQMLHAADSRTRSLLGDSPPLGAPDSGGERIGEQVGPFRITDRIGEGGFGVVYLARQDEPIARRVALKIIRPGMDSQRVIARFDSERRMLALMDHRHVARVIDAGLTPAGRPYFAMEYVDGIPITAHCDQRRLSLGERIELFIPVCEAIEHAHQRGVIHRDIKPGNILVASEQTADGRRTAVPKVIDFGVAKAIQPSERDDWARTMTGQFLGTPAYMSPEQAGGSFDQVDTRTDVYSLGVVLYELIVGARPFEAAGGSTQSPIDLLRAVRELDPPRPANRLSDMGPLQDALAASRGTTATRLRADLRRELEWIPLKAVEKDPDRRYGSAADLARDLRNYLSQRPLLAGPPSRAYLVRKFVRRNRGAVAAAALIVAITIAGLAGLWATAAWALRERRNTEAQLAIVRQREAELEQVVQFQQKMFSGARLPVMGAAILDDLRAQMASHPAASAAPTGSPQPADSLVGIDSVGLATSAMDRGVLAPAKIAIQDDFAGQPLVQARLLETLSSNYFEIGRYRASREYREQAMEILRRERGENNPDTIRLLNGIGLAQRAEGHVAEAAETFSKVVELRAETLGPDHADTVAAKANLGAALAFQGKLLEAEPLMRDAMDWNSRAGGDELALDQATFNYAFLLYRLERFDQAEPLMRQTVDRRLRLHGADSILVADARHNLGYLFLRTGRAAEARPMLEEVLDQNRKRRGSEHPYTLSALGALATADEALGRYEEAEALFRTMADGRRRTLGPDHASTLLAMNNLAHVMLNAGRAAEAEQMFRDTLERAIATLGEAHQTALQIRANHGLSLLALGRASEAEAQFRACAQAAEENLPQGHLARTTTRWQFAAALLAKGDAEGAEPLFRQVLADTLAAKEKANRLPPERIRGALAESLIAQAVASLNGASANDSIAPAAVRDKLAEAEALLSAGDAQPGNDAPPPPPALAEPMSEPDRSARRHVALYQAWQRVEPTQQRAEALQNWQRKAKELQLGPASGR